MHTAGLVTGPVELAPVTLGISVVSDSTLSVDAVRKSKIFHYGVLAPCKDRAESLLFCNDCQYVFLKY